MSCRIGGPIVHDFIDSTGISDDAAALTARMRRDGYLLLRNLIPVAEIAALQRQIAAIARDAGWLRADAPLEAALADPAGFCVDPEPRYLEVLRRINRLEAYHTLKHHPALTGFFARLLGAPVFPHPRVLMRNIFPQREEFTTKAHQDFPNVQGTEEVYTAWFPLLDCPLELGPLQIAAGTHLDGVYDFHIGAGAGGIEITDPLEGRWHAGPMQAGDVLVFHSMTVHKGLPNRSERLRMSMDVRFQRVADPFCPDNANPDGQPLTWEEVYAGWQDTSLQYYWRRLKLTPKPFDPQWFHKRDALAFELAEAGDPRAASVLQRIVARDADPARRQRAQALLDRLSPA
jgi:hypothetical protein